MQQQKKGHGGSRKHGRNVAKCTAYKAAKTRERHKSKRVFQSNGLEAYIKYCKENGIAPKKLSRRERNVRQMAGGLPTDNATVRGEL